MLRSSLRALRTLFTRPNTARRRPRLNVEGLEERALLATNLWVTDAYLTDADGNKIDKAAVGSLVYVQTEFKTDDLPANADYRIRFTVDGESKMTGVLDWGAGSSSVKSWVARWGNWLVKPGAQTVKVELDATHTVGESSGADNDKSFSFTPITFSSAYGQTKFVTPIGGVPFVHWTIINYSDLDTREGSKIDYMGGGRTYDGHDALDITLTGWGTDDRWKGMDVGLPVLAAADGVVVGLRDGEFDRNTGWQGVGPANYITIDHGNGWTTSYLHLRKNSVAVQKGDYVKAGQMIGLVGSSGRSTDPHLHFSVYHKGNLVESYVAPNSYWVSPLPYAPTMDGTPMSHYSSYHITENGGSVSHVVVTPNFLLGGQVKYATQDISAAAGSDYVGKSGTLTFAPGELFKMVTVPITDDGRNENAESFRFRVTQMDGDLIWSRDWTIIDNDEMLNFDKATGKLTLNGDTNAASETIRLDVDGSDLVFVVNGTTQRFPKAGVTSIKIVGSASADTVNIYSTPSGLKTTVETLGGNDTVNIGQPGELFDLMHTLSTIDGEVSVIGGSGTDKLFLLDNTMAAPSRSYTLTGNALTRSGMAKISHSQMENVELSAGEGNDTLTLSGSPSTTPFLFKGNDGTDTLVGPNSATTFNVTGANTGNIGTGAFKFAGVENLTGGSAKDTFALKTGGSLTGKINGGVGTDLLDYTGRVTAVTVDLSAGTATSVIGGILNLENVKGGSGGDTITGNNLDNLLDGAGGNDAINGLGGNDILLGGAGVDVLNGGDGRDIVFGGLGGDFLNGGNEEDLLVGGTSTFDTKPDVLNLFMQQWKRVDLTYAQRVDKLRTTGVTLGSTYKFNAMSMFDDGVIDNLSGLAAQDWLWAGAVDLHDAAADETVN